MVLEYLVGGVLLCLTIVGIPFGGEVRANKCPVGCLNTLLNIIWIFVGGIWIALSHLLWGLLFCITIVGIPFGLRHFKLMSFPLVPFGRTIIRR